MSSDDYQQPATPQSTRSIPINELDLTYMTTEPAWGREAPEALRDLMRDVSESVYVDEETGQLMIPARSIWESLAMYTRDLRLGNLGGRELLVATHWLNLANDLLRAGYIQTFMTAMSRVITTLELSQSKGGFLRKRQGTITHEKIGNDNSEPSKRNLVGGRRRS